MGESRQETASTPVVLPPAMPAAATGAEDPLEAQELSHEIVNGDFTAQDVAADDFGWTSRGMVEVVEGQAVLREDSQVQTRLMQRSLYS